jgi:hypothetical protein
MGLKNRLRQAKRVGIARNSGEYAHAPKPVTGVDGRVISFTPSPSTLISGGMTRMHRDTQMRSAQHALRLAGLPHVVGV